MKINRNCLQTSARFGKRERHIIFEWIKTRPDVIIQQMDKADHRSLDDAWPKPVGTWLRCQILISCPPTQSVTPFTTQTGIINCLDAQVTTATATTIRQQDGGHPETFSRSIPDIFVKVCDR